MQLIPKWAELAVLVIMSKFLGTGIIWVLFPGSPLPHPDIDQWKHTMYTNESFICRAMSCHNLTRCIWYIYLHIFIDTMKWHKKYSYKCTYKPFKSDYKSCNVCNVLKSQQGFSNIRGCTASTYCTWTVLNAQYSCFTLEQFAVFCNIWECIVSIHHTGTVCSVLSVVLMFHTGTFLVFFNIWGCTVSMFLHWNSFVVVR